ncbi:MAG: cupin domain-containing protein, partial [Nanoarchaeota archaeon]
KINLIEDVIVVPKGEIPCHAHEFTDEIFYIIDNSAIMIVNNQEFEVNPGNMIYVDKKESHGFRNESDKEFKMIVFKINFQKGDSYLK